MGGLGAAMTATIILDFDGTIALGNGPVIAYANAVARQADSSDMLTESLLALAAFQSGKLDCNDGYGAVAEAARQHGMTDAELNTAYMQSRHLLGTDEAPVETPPGLAGFIERLAPSTEVWLATNAPDIGVSDLLRRDSLDDSFARKHFNLGKPAGLFPVLREALERGPVLSVGDVYDYDLAPAIELGADSALVGRTFDVDSRDVMLRARSLDALFPAIESWAAHAATQAGPSDEAPTHQEKET